MPEVLAELFQHNVWANARLCEACLGLDDAQLDARADGTYGSLRDTLVHLVGAQERYVSLISGAALADAPREGDPFPGVAALAERCRASSLTLVDLAASATDGVILRGIRRGQPYELPQWLPLIQAINHATEHRAHIATVLSQHGVQPPDIDGWAYHDALGAG